VVTVIAAAKVVNSDDQNGAVERLLGETVREIGILVFVFAPLDAALADHPPDLSVVIAVAAGALGAIVVGIMLETED
jgi:hypothetical protein